MLVSSFVLGLTAAPILAEGRSSGDRSSGDRYSCHFWVKDYAAAGPLWAQPSHQVMTMKDGQQATFRGIGPATGAPAHLVSNDGDPAAGAVAVVGDDGRAFLSVHGLFPNLDAVTYSGRCQAEGE